MLYHYTVKFFQNYLNILMQTPVKTCVTLKFKHIFLDFPSTSLTFSQIFDQNPLTILLLDVLSYSKTSQSLLNSQVHMFNLEQKLQTLKKIEKHHHEPTYIHIHSLVLIVYIHFVPFKPQICFQDILLIQLFGFQSPFKVCPQIATTASPCSSSCFLDSSGLSRATWLLLCLSHLFCSHILQNLILLTQHVIFGYFPNHIMPHVSFIIHAKVWPIIYINNLRNILHSQN